MLERALATLSRQRDVVRARVENFAGDPVLHFDTRPRFESVSAPDGDAIAALSARVWQPFDFAHDGLFRALFTEVEGERHMAIVTHHLVSDAASFTLLWSELWRNYAFHLRGIEPPPSKATSYGDYLDGLNAWRQTPHGQAQISEFATRLLPLAQTSPVAPAQSLSPRSIQIEGDLLADLRSAAADLRVTLSCMLLAAQVGVLNELHPGRPALIASVHSGRDHPKLLDVAGYLADRSFYLIAPIDDPSPSALVGAAWGATADVARRRFVRFDFLRDHLASRGLDLVAPYFNFAGLARRANQASPQACSPVSSPAASPGFISPVRLASAPVFSGPGPDTCDYGLALAETPDMVKGEWQPKAPYDASLADRFMAHLDRLAGLAPPR